MMNPDQIPRDPDAWIDRLLQESARAHADDYLPDDGFTARVVAALPAPATLPAWRKPALIALWATAGLAIAAALPGAAADTAHEVLRVLATHRFSVSEVGAVLAALGAASWAATAYALRE